MDSNARQTQLQTLVEHVRRFLQFPGNENAWSNVIVRMQATTDVGLLKELATQFPLEPQILVLAWKRVTQLTSDKDELLRAANVFYSNGLDDDASALVEQVLQEDAQYIPALELKAYLTRDDEERKRIYQLIVNIDPKNENAFHHLLMLR